MTSARGTSLVGKAHALFTSLGVDRLVARDLQRIPDELQVFGVDARQLDAHDPRGQLFRRVRAVFAFALFLVACGIANTPEQDLAYARWAKCNSTSATLERVDLDGQIIFRYTTAGEREEIVRCLAEAGRTGPALPEPAGLRPPGGP